METNIALTLLLAGVISGLVNFFANYINLSFSKPENLLDDDTKLKDIWWIALLGYSIVGIAGAFLTPVINAIFGGLKGLEIVIVNGSPGPKEISYNYILFGYGIIFGYSTTKILLTLLNSLIKKIAKTEARLNQLQEITSLNKSEVHVATAQDIIDECENQFEAHKSECSGFVIAVANKFGIQLTGQADDIVTQIETAGWTVLSDGVDAKNKADAGLFVIAGLKSGDHNPPRTHGHVVVVVSGDLAYNKYPTGYWGTLGGTGRKNTTINYAWNASDRDNVIYSAKIV